MTKLTSKPFFKRLAGVAMLLSTMGSANAAELPAGVTLVENTSSAGFYAPDPAFCEISASKADTATATSNTVAIPKDEIQPCETAIAAGKQYKPQNWVVSNNLANAMKM